MGNSHNGCKINETNFKAIIKTELLKLFFKTKREREKVDYYNCYFKKKYLKKNDNNNWDESVKNVESPKNW